jgi:hypothetical protein
MEQLDTGIAGLTCVFEDTACTYTKQGGGVLLFDGEYAFGEAWINDEWYWWERDTEKGVVLMGTDDDCKKAVYTFEDSEEGFAAFANSVL